MNKPRQKRHFKKPEVLRLIAEGFTNQEIARAMDMRPENVAAIRRQAIAGPSHHSSTPPKYGLAAELYQSSALELHQLAMRRL